MAMAAVSSWWRTGLRRIQEHNNVVLDSGSAVCDRILDPSFGVCSVFLPVFFVKYNLILYS